MPYIGMDSWQTQAVNDSFRQLFYFLYAYGSTPALFILILTGQQFLHSYAGSNPEEYE